MAFRRQATDISASRPIGALSSRRATRLRISWYILGMVSGMALSWGLATAVSGATPPTEKDILSQDNSPETLPPIAELAPLNMLATLDATPAALKKPEAKKDVVYPLSLDLEVRKGDTLLTLLTDTEIPFDEAYNVVQSVRKIYNPKRLNVGQSVALTLDKMKNGEEAPVVTTLSIPVSNIRTIHLTRTDDGDFKVEEVKEPLKKAVTRSGGNIRSSLYQTGLDSGIPAHLLAEVINAYSYDVDFQRDIQHGDHFDVLFERMQTESGEVGGYGNVIYAALNLGGKEMRVYRYEDRHGNVGYYNEKGESVKKALLRTPINGARISSGFGMRRHPILGYSKMHKGVDFAAGTGTPIYAAGDGVVKMASRNGAYGNYVKIQHNDKYATAYGHVSRFGKGIRPGVKVKQGQVVAYVGSTGRSTGPHLHYEILAYGSQVNPAGAKFKAGNTLAGRELAAFKENIRQVQTQLASLPRGKTQLAMADTTKKDAKN